MDECIFVGSKDEHCVPLKKMYETEIRKSTDIVGKAQLPKQLIQSKEVHRHTKGEEELPQMKSLNPCESTHGKSKGNYRNNSEIYDSNLVESELDSEETSTMTINQQNADHLPLLVKESYPMGGM